ncbi:MAG: class I SAM-dependent methyltransferase [Candidatus Thorarchaeota archaeon]
MKDAVAGKPTKYSIERDDGRIDEDLVSTYITPYSDWSEGEKLAIKEVQGRVLDIGCGAGRVALYLQEMGFEVIGIDISQGAIEACRERGIGSVQVMSAENLDFEDGIFSTIILYGNNFGLLGNKDRVVKMLKDCHRISSKEALILANGNEVTLTENPLHLQYHEKNRKAGRPIGMMTIRISYNEIVTDWFDLLLAGPKLMAELAEESGWFLDKTYGPLDNFVGVLRKR